MGFLLIRGSDDIDILTCILKQLRGWTMEVAEGQNKSINRMYHIHTVEKKENTIVVNS
jgi:hypothetical protein